MRRSTRLPTCYTGVDRNLSLKEVHMDDPFDATAHVSPAVAAILALRGHFTLPTFQEPVQGQRHPLYLVYDAYPLSEQEASQVISQLPSKPTSPTIRALRADRRMPSLGRK